MRPLLTALLMTAACAAQAQNLQKFPATQLTAGIHLITAEVAANEPQREQGLMFRKQMGPNEGMVFVFDRPGTVCMWMKNTLLPLSVAFLDANGRIVNIEDMAPQTLDSHCGKGDAIAYALEMNQGWFRQKNIKAGTLLAGLPPLPAAGK
jgi:uncharacterized membrane protein (UPF0127 family)